MVKKEKINDLPSTFGVYLFKKGDEVFYVGKSVNIKARVRSHIENARLDKKEFLIVDQADRIETIVTESEFKALILESKLIKKFHPKYNVIWKDNKSYLYIKITMSEEYPKVIICRKEDDGKSRYFGPFSSVKVGAELIDDIRHIIPFCTQKNISKIPCFYSKINLCDPCPNKIVKIKDENIKRQEKKQYRKNIRQVAGILEGHVEPVIKNLYRQLKQLIKSQNFEKAIVIRSKILRMERLVHFPLINNDVLSSKIGSYTFDLLDILKKYFPNLKKLNRIEGYDISNLGNNQIVGSMVVLSHGVLDKGQYRKFKIKNNQAVSDFERLEEALTRRLKTGWPAPDLIVIDGGKPQVKVIKKLLRSQKNFIPVIGIAKNPDRLVLGVDNFPTIRPSINNNGFNLIRLIRDESHRFARKYHLFLRDKDFLV